MFVDFTYTIAGKIELEVDARLQVSEDEVEVLELYASHNGQDLDIDDLYEYSASYDGPIHLHTILSDKACEVANA